MNETQLNYFKEQDVLHIALTHEAEANSVEIRPNITAELNAAGELIGIEVLKASQFMRDIALELAQERLLEVAAPTAD